MQTKKLVHTLSDNAKERTSLTTILVSEFSTTFLTEDFSILARSDCQKNDIIVIYKHTLEWKLLSIMQKMFTSMDEFNEQGSNTTSP